MSQLLSPSQSCDPSFPTSDYDAGQCLAFHVSWLVLNIVLWSWAILNLTFVFIHKVKWNISHFILLAVIGSLSIQILRLGLLVPEDRNVNLIFLSFLYSYWIFFSFLAYCTLVLLWGQLYHAAIGLRVGLLPKVKIVLISINAAIFILLTIVSVLAVTTTGSAPSYIRAIYAALTVIIAIAFILYGGRLVRMMSSQVREISRRSNNSALKTIFIWTAGGGVTFIAVAIFQLATRFDRSSSQTAFVMRHSIYNSCAFIGMFLIILSFRGLRFWKNPKIKVSPSPSKAIGKSSSESVSEVNQIESASSMGESKELVQLAQSSGGKDMEGDSPIEVRIQS
eukprot:TRINITY_DN7313_c0_g1_i1.p1 TRINITY_DN7313_c0_g1~~TRINITY_DN7313_c0_g1_i1.p1  ORF type:complete len:337 (-),score=39.10 TRINITY_DN7313_c0_g1_i1:85-1095(-)